MLTNTHQLSLCESCNCVVQTLMDDDGNRFCGKCKKPLQKTLSDIPESSLVNENLKADRQ